MIEQWQLNQVIKLSQQQPELLSRVFEDIFREHGDLWYAIVIGAYLDQEINLGRAAELLGLSRAELQKRFLMQGIPLRLGPQDIAEAHAELNAIESWR